MPESPTVGQYWLDGLNPGWYWAIVDISPVQVAHAVLYSPNGDITDGYMAWPVDRWKALVESRLLDGPHDEAPSRDFAPAEPVA